MSPWRSVVTVEELNALSAGTLGERLGMRFTEIGVDYLRGTMIVDGNLQPFGLLHGGASVALAETLGSMAGWLCVDRERYACVGQEINANHLRPVRVGAVTGTARPVYLGGRSQVWSIEIVDDRSRLTCVSRLTLAVVPASPRKSGAAH